MVWTDEHTTVAIKAIATVDPNLRYGAINYNNPVTVGVV